MSKCKSFLIAIWVIGGFCNLTANAKDTMIADDKSVVYDGSLDLPDGIAFQQFLLLTKGHITEPDRKGQLVLLSSALGHKHDLDGDYEYLRPRLEALDQRRRSFDKARTDRELATLCTDNRASRSQAQSHDAMNALDDIVIEEAQSQLDAFMRNLSANEQESFSQYLEKIKKSTTYERIDSNLASSEVAVDVENQCTFLNNKQLSMRHE